MLKILSILFFSVLFVGCTTAQFPYSTSNKKAIKLFEEAQKAPEVYYDQQKGPNYLKGIEIAYTCQKRWSPKYRWGTATVMLQSV
jgi:hypothetical protein